MPKRVYTNAHVSVRFMGDTLDPLDVTLALRLPYDHIHRKGEPRLTRQRNGTVREAAVYQQGMWSMSSKDWVDSPVLDTHLCWVLDQLEPRAQTVHELMDAGATVDIFCYSFGSTPEPPALPRETGERALALGISIGIDHYQDRASRADSSFRA